MKKILGIVVLGLLIYNQNFIGNTVFADDNFDCDAEPKFSQTWYYNKCDAASKTENDLKILYSDLADPMQGPQLMRITIACSKSPKGRAFSDSFYAVVTENTFQGSRDWEEKTHGNRVADKGYEIFTGWKSKKNLTISVKGRFVNSSDRWSWKLKSDGKLPMLEHLRKGLNGIRGKKDWRRTCDLKYVYKAKAEDAAAVQNVKKNFYRVVKQRNSLEEEVNKLRSQIASLNSEKSIKEIDKKKKSKKKVEENLKDQEMKLEDQTEKKKIIEEKIKLQKKQQKKAEEKIKVEEEKKQKVDLIVAQNLINDIEEFIKKNPDEFDVIEIFQLLIANEEIKDGIWGENSRENYQKLSDFVNNSDAFKSYHLAKEEERSENAVSATNE